MITREEVRKAFPDLSLLVVPDQALDQDFTNVAARRVLTEVGLPRWVGETITFDPRVRDKVRSVADVLSEYGKDVPDRPRHRYIIGTIKEDLILVDGKSGAVYQMAGEGDVRVQFLSAGLDEFVQFLCYLQDGIGRIYAPEFSPEQWDEGASQLAAEAMIKLRDIDPDAYTRAESTWHEIVENLVFAE